MDQFLSMGGYGFYIWTSYAVTGAIMALLIGVTMRAKRRTERALAQADSLRPRRPRDADAAG